MMDQLIDGGDFFRIVWYENLYSVWEFSFLRVWSWGNLGIGIWERFQTDPLHKAK